MRQGVGELQGGLLRFLDGGGEMGALMRAHDWASTPPGSPAEWPQALRTAIRLSLNAGHPMYIFWGAEGLCFYNDAYRRLIGNERHPASLGRPAAEVWQEIWPDIGPQIDQVMSGGPATWHENQLLPITRDGVRTDVYWTYSYSAIDDDSALSGVGGVLVVCTETTLEVTTRIEMQSAESRYRAMADNAPAVLWTTDTAGYCTYLNSQWYQITGQGRDEAEGFGWLDATHPDDAIASREAFLGANAAQEPFQIEYRLLQANGIYRWSLDRGNPHWDENGIYRGMVGHVIDIDDRKRAETTLRDSEARFRAAIDTVHGVLWTNTPDGEMVGDQLGWSALTGQSLRDYEGYGWADAIHPDDARPTIDAWNEAVCERRPFEFEHRVRRHDGEWRHFAVRAAPTFDDNGGIIEWIGVHTDVTDERTMQAALLESEENYRFAVELHPQVTWTATPDGQLDRVSERWREWTGTSGLGTTWGEGLHPEDLDYTTEAWVDSVTSGRPYDVEHRVKHIDGRYRWARSRAFARRGAGGDVVKWYGSTEDIDDRKQAEIRAYETARELRGVVEAMPGFVWTADDQGGITYTSPSWQIYSGSKPEDSIGAGWAGFVHPDDQVVAFGQWAASLASSEPYEVEFRLRAANGQYHWWMARARKQPEGGWIGTATELDAIVAARDTLARSREELEIQVEARTAELRETEEQLRQSQKLEAVGQLTGGVAHDFNNLLTVIRGSVDLLRRPGITEAKRDRYIDAIGDTVTRAAKLTGQLLAFARRQALQPDVFDVGQGLTGIADMVGTLTGSRIRVDMILPDAPLHIDADPSQFDTAVVNMVANARDAMGGEGTLTICLSGCSGIPANGGPAVSGDFVAVAITDTGSGIAPDVQLQIFEPFYTTKGIGQGTGLGLSQVYGFAKQSGGEIRLRSASGEGSTFTLYLPRVAAPVVGPAPDPGAGRVAEGGGTCVLVVEDNPDVGHFAKQTLAELGYNTVFAENGSAALAELAADHARFDVIFSDVMMPGMSGIELGEEIRKSYPGLPVVLTSGYSHVLAQQGSAGFELLHKPYSMEELSRVLQKAALRRDPA